MFMCTECLEYLLNMGHIKHFLTDLVRQSDILRSPQPLLAICSHTRSSYMSQDHDAVNEMAVYQSKLAFLIRIGESPEGATCLFSSGVIEALSNCSFIDLRPADSAIENASWLDVINRYYALLLPGSSSSLP